MAWTSKHQEFAAKNGWWQSAINVGNYLYKRVRSDEPIEIEFDSDKFNNWIKKVRGKKYHRTTIPKAVKHLAENSQGAVVIMRDYGKGVFKLRVFPLSYVSENENSKTDSSRSAAAGKGFGSNVNRKKRSEKLQQQQKLIDRVDALFQKIGLRFDRDALINIWRLSGGCISRVVRAIELMLHRNQSKKIPKPHGFIIDCLKKRWAEGFDLYYEPELPTFNSKKDLRHFVHEITKSINGDGQKNATPYPT